MNESRETVLYMSPALPKNNGGDDLLRDAVSCSDSCLRLSIGDSMTDRTHPIVRQLRHAVCRAVSMPTFRDGIGFVVCRGADEQMRRITAGRIVATVQDVLSWLERAIRLFIGHAMRSPLAAVFVADDAVAISVSGASPDPARSWFAWREIPGEAFREGQCASGIATGLRAIRTAWSAWWSQATVFAQVHPRTIARMDTVSQG